MPVILLRWTAYPPSLKAGRCCADVIGMDPTKDALSEAVEALRDRLHAGEIDEAGFRAARDHLLERRRVQRSFDGPERRLSPPLHP